MTGNHQRKLINYKTTLEKEPLYVLFSLLQLSQPCGVSLSPFLLLFMPTLVVSYQHAVGAELRAIKLKGQQDIYGHGGAGAYLQQYKGEKRVTPPTGRQSMAGQHTGQTTMHIPIPT
ncbi:hypothetical protein ILYODFUR_014050 [Ilyodon furcidens]|uniref:Uncharacterized protein n=1 Tax=Ilyodon furcidens TaxID=33524 RepID=A0ABV0TUW3_9TELE